MKTSIDPCEDETSIGRILLDTAVITPWQLSEGIAYALAEDKRLGEALEELGYVSESDVRIALDLQRARRATKTRDIAAHTLNLMAQAAEQSAPLDESIATMRECTDSIARRFRVRRRTGGA